MRTLKIFAIFMMVAVSIPAQAEEKEKSALEMAGGVVLDVAKAKAQHETAEWTFQKVCFGKNPAAAPMLIALVAIFCAIAGKIKYNRKSWWITAIAIIAVARLIVMGIEESEANQTLVMWMSIGLTPVILVLLTIKWWKQLFLARRRKRGWKFFWSDKVGGSSVKINPETLRQIGMGQPLTSAQPQGHLAKGGGGQYPQFSGQPGFSYPQLSLSQGLRCLSCGTAMAPNALRCQSCGQMRTNGRLQSPDRPQQSAGDNDVIDADFSLITDDY